MLLFICSRYVPTGKAVKRTYVSVYGTRQSFLMGNLRMRQKLKTYNVFTDNLECNLDGLSRQSFAEMEAVQIMFEPRCMVRTWFIWIFDDDWSVVWLKYICRCIC